VPRARRRTFSNADKRRILQAADLCTKPGEVGALMRREGVYSSSLAYFAVGHSRRCFSFVSQWVERKIRRHMLRARKRKGFGWARWSRRWLYAALGLFNGYRVRYYAPTASPAR
jgi:hypothetical protein